MAAGAPPLLLRVLALASTLPILELYALPAMDSNPALSPPAADEEGRPAAQAPPLAGNSANWELAVQGGGSSTLR
jgi:hypothetical protein